MDQNINNAVSDFEAFNANHVINSVREKALSPSENVQKNNEIQQQAKYLNRVLEAYSDCV